MIRLDSYSSALNVLHAFTCMTSFGCVSAETHALMHMLGLDELPDASDLLVALGRVHVSNHMAKEATNARLSKVSPKKRAAGDSGAAEIAPIRRPRRVPGGDPLDVSMQLPGSLLSSLLRACLPACLSSAFWIQLCHLRIGASKQTDCLPL